ncbi:MAG: SDR family NAD(P)-dependent oxidoreductase [Pseudomonadales bacterium]
MTDDSVTRTALITGASAGLGREFAQQLAANGCNLVLVARRQARLDELATELAQRYAVDVQIICTDLSRRDAVDHIAAAVGARQIDWLVNNAGSGGADLLDCKDWQAHEAFYRLMMTAVAQLCHLYAPAMRQRGFGRIVNVASVAGRIALAGGCNYGPTKAYVIALSEELSQTLHGTGVHVCALCPGFTHTEFHDAAGLTQEKAATPKWLWYSAETVVREGLRAVERGKPIHLSGRLYRWLDPWLQSVWTRPLVRLVSRSPKGRWRDPNNATSA